MKKNKRKLLLSVDITPGIWKLRPAFTVEKRFSHITGGYTNRTRLFDWLCFKLVIESTDNGNVEHYRRLHRDREEIAVPVELAEAPWSTEEVVAEGLVEREYGIWGIYGCPFDKDLAEYLTDYIRKYEGEEVELIIRRQSLNPHKVEGPKPVGTVTGRFSCLEPNITAEPRSIPQDPENELPQ